jgi:hypothetical protein
LLYRRLQLLVGEALYAAIPRDGGMRHSPAWLR